MSKVSNVYPEWVEKYRKKGVTIRKVRNGYGLYRVTSVYVKGNKYPKNVQEYLGMIYEDKGFIAKVKKNDSPCYIEYGLSSFIMNNFKRDLLRTSYDHNMNIVKLGIVYYVFDDIDEDYLNRSCLTYEDKEVKEYYKKANLNRIKTVSKKINELFKQKIKDDKDLKKIISLLKISVIDPETRILPEYDEVLVSLLRKYGDFNV